MPYKLCYHSLKPTHSGQGCKGGLTDVKELCSHCLCCLLWSAIILAVLLYSVYLCLGGGASWLGYQRLAYLPSTPSDWARPLGACAALASRGEEGQLQKTLEKKRLLCGVLCNMGSNCMHMFIPHRPLGDAEEESRVMRAPDLVRLDPPNTCLARRQLCWSNHSTYSSTKSKTNTKKIGSCLCQQGRPCGLCCCMKTPSDL